MATSQLQPANFSTHAFRTWIAKAIVPSSLVLLALPAIAAPLTNGRYSFDRAPQLVRVNSNAAQTNGRNHTYELVITVPQDAGAPLQAITISQPQTTTPVTFQPSATRVVAGNSGQEIPLVNVGGTPANPGELTLVLHHAVQPGETVTIQLTGDRNPSSSGIYLLGVTAYPAGDNSPGLFLGYGRVTVYAPAGG